jgi:hypothetical protein
MLKLTALNEFFKEMNVDLNMPMRIADRELTTRIMLWRNSASPYVVASTKKALVDMGLLAISVQPGVWDVPKNRPDTDADRVDNILELSRDE